MKAVTPEAAIVYAAETRGIIQVMQFLLVIAGMLVLWVGGAWLLLKIRVRGWKKHQGKLFEKIASQRAEIEALTLMVGDVEALKVDVTRVTRIREKTEARLTEQNAELAVARGRIAFLQKIVDHVDT